MTPLKENRSVGPSDRVCVDRPLLAATNTDIPWRVIGAA
jgi:hypothetical protein